jgi:hypothetical protein
MRQSGACGSCSNQPAFGRNSRDPLRTDLSKRLALRTDSPIGGKWPANSVSGETSLFAFATGQQESLG